MASSFNPQDWYWSVAGDAANVYSSARNIYVPISDAAYVAWQAATGITPAQNVSAETDIWAYVQPFHPWWMFDTVAGTVAQPTLTTYTKTQLQQYNSDLRTRKVAGGMVAAGIPVLTDDVSRGFINDARTHAVDNANYTTVWYGSDGHFYPADAQTIIAMSDAVTQHTTDCYTVFANTDNTIVTTTDITMTSQIDALYSAL